MLSRKPQPIPGDLDILVAGFSCKDRTISRKVQEATSNKCHASSNKCLTSSNKKLLLLLVRHLLLARHLFLLLRQIEMNKTLNEQGRKAEPTEIP